MPFQKPTKEQIRAAPLISLKDLSVGSYYARINNNRFEISTWFKINKQHIIGGPDNDEPYEVRGFIPNDNIYSVNRLIIDCPLEIEEEMYAVWTRYKQQNNL